MARVYADTTVQVRSLVGIHFVGGPKRAAAQAEAAVDDGSDFFISVQVVEPLSRYIVSRPML